MADYQSDFAAQEAKLRASAAQAEAEAEERVASMCAEAEPNTPTP